MAKHHPECDFRNFPRNMLCVCHCEELRERDRKRNERAKQPYTYMRHMIVRLATGPDINDSEDNFDQQVEAVMDYLKYKVAGEVRSKFHFTMEFTNPY